MAATVAGRGVLEMQAGVLEFASVVAVTLRAWAGVSDFEGVGIVEVCVRVCVRACVRACVGSGWVGGWVGGWAGVFRRECVAELKGHDHVVECLAFCR